MDEQRFEFVVTENVFADDASRFCATLGDYDLDCPTGFGETPADAIRDWLDMHEDKLLEL